MDLDKEKAASEEYRKSLRIKATNIDVGVSTLSGGNQQKVVLSKWMFTEPDILILDEPTRGIDVGAKYEIYKLIHELADQGKAVIWYHPSFPSFWEWRTGDIRYSKALSRESCKEAKRIRNH